MRCRLEFDIGFRGIKRALIDDRHRCRGRVEMIRIRFGQSRVRGSAAASYKGASPPSAKGLLARRDDPQHRHLRLHEPRVARHVHPPVRIEVTQERARFCREAIPAIPGVQVGEAHDLVTLALRHESARPAHVVGEKLAEARALGPVPRCDGDDACDIRAPP